MGVFLTQAPMLALHAQPVGHVSGPTHTLQTLFSQRDVLQSAALEQRLPRAQRSHVGPPQSTSLSPPLMSPSLQVASGGDGGDGGGGGGDDGDSVPFRFLLRLRLASASATPRSTLSA